MRYSQIFLMVLFSFVKLSALEKDCPYECDKYLGKSAFKRVQYLLLQEAFPPKGEYELSALNVSEGYCNYQAWPQFRKSWDCDKPDICLETEKAGYSGWLEPGIECEYVEDLGSYLTTMNFIEDEIEKYIAHQSKIYSEVLAWNEKAISHFKALQAKGVHKCCGEFYEVKDGVVEKIESEERLRISSLEKLKEIQLEAIRLRNLCLTTHQDVLETYNSGLNHCLENHHWNGAYYGKGLLAFHLGKMTDAFDNIQAFLEGLDEKSKKELSKYAVFNKGVIESEVGLYNEAILSLTQAIEKDPNFKDAYFERAIAYFETGYFDQSLQDYLKSDRKFKFLEETDLLDVKDFGAGLVKGGLQGFYESANAFLPSICNSVSGVGHFVWMTIQHPINTPKQLVVDTMKLCEYLRSCDKAELAQLLVPEMYELIVNWSNLQYARRGELMGYC
ncbi:MAG TPA: hypothetical protein VFU89_06030 [Rhabdochlamydiaceae bacterium]|nr:hypothetical protein [Rhabdochlamydiaceae bacterium]